MIYINDIPSFRNPESHEHKYDDRVEKIELIYGNTAQDYGYVSNGDVDIITCLFTEANFMRLLPLWGARTPINYTDETGLVWQNLRIVFKSHKRDQHFPGYVLLTFELWRV